MAQGRLRKFLDARVLVGPVNLQPLANVSARFKDGRCVVRVEKNQGASTLSLVTSMTSPMIAYKVMPSVRFLLTHVFVHVLS